MPIHLKKTFNQNHTIMEHVFQHAFYIPLHQKNKHGFYKVSVVNKIKETDHVTIS